MSHVTLPKNVMSHMKKLQSITTYVHQVPSTLAISAPSPVPPVLSMIASEQPHQFSDGNGVVYLHWHHSDVVIPAIDQNVSG